MSDKKKGKGEPTKISHNIWDNDVYDNGKNSSSPEIREKGYDVVRAEKGVNAVVDRDHSDFAH